MARGDKAVVQANEDDLDTCLTVPCFTFGSRELRFREGIIANLTILNVG